MRMSSEVNVDLKLQFQQASSSLEWQVPGEEGDERWCLAQFRSIRFYSWVSDAEGLIDSSRRQ